MGDNSKLEAIRRLPHREVSPYDQADPPPQDIAAAWWAACHSGQRPTAEQLLQHGAELTWIAPWDGLTPLDAARRSDATDLATWLLDHGANPATDLDAGKG